MIISKGRPASTASAGPSIAVLGISFPIVQDKKRRMNWKWVVGLTVSLSILAYHSDWFNDSNPTTTHQVCWGKIK